VRTLPTHTNALCYSVPSHSRAGDASQGRLHSKGRQVGSWYRTPADFLCKSPDPRERIQYHQDECKKKCQPYGSSVTLVPYGDKIFSVPSRFEPPYHVRTLPTHTNALCYSVPSHLRAGDASQGRLRGTLVTVTLMSPHTT